MSRLQLRIKPISTRIEGEPLFLGTVPILFARDVSRAAAFYAEAKDQ